MSQDLRANLKQWLESGEIRLQPLSLPQRELWENSPVPPGDIGNHICAFIEVKGNITAEDCTAALRLVVERQEVLRLSFLPGKGQPFQMIRRTGIPAIKYRDLEPDQCTPAGIEGIMDEIFRQPFDMLRGPLYRVEMLQKGPGDLVLVFAIHHSIADGWTLGVFVQDLAGAYIQNKLSGGGPLPSVEMSYTAWAAAERATWQPVELELRAEFWRKHLADTIRLWDRPTDVAQRAGKLAYWASSIPPDLVREIRTLSKNSGTTLFNTLLTAFQTMLAQWTGQTDIVVGSPVANRTRQPAKETMGYFAGVVPLRGKVDTTQSFSTAARAVQDSSMDCFAQAMPFAELVKSLGISQEEGHNPIFDVRFALQNHPVPDVTLPSLSFKLRMRSTGTARFDLACEITEDGDEFEVVWLYRPGLFTLADAEELNRRYQTLLENVSRSPHSPLSAILA
ncbi:condensation domain-containing protein [Prosthecobacter fusiformis]|uniref:Condensation domain-containing protein n=1 Tax=Prosthecobacter fusiformis TaxID=48464 RepID=A0A4R7STW1_9BACT|nr:condensation domain-containing protein [Prosthecobacter fusiformis]TDU81698.1 condensation domain-containing protein [Prosthecobacter fusiformis]